MSLNFLPKIFHSLELCQNLKFFIRIKTKIGQKMKHLIGEKKDFQLCPEISDISAKIGHQIRHKVKNGLCHQVNHTVKINK